MIDQELFKQHSPQLYNIGKQLADRYRQQLVAAQAVASGTLKNFKWDIKLLQNGLSLVFYLPQYWRYIEFGRRKTVNNGPGTVRRMIEEWIKDKGITPRVMRDKKGRAYTPTEKQLAYLISRKIHSVGYDARHPLQDAINASKPLEQQFVNTAAKIYTEQVKDMILQLNTTK